MYHEGYLLHPFSLSLSKAWSCTLKLLKQIGFSHCFPLPPTPPHFLLTKRFVFMIEKLKVHLNLFSYFNGCIYCSLEMSANSFLTSLLTFFLSLLPLRASQLIRQPCQVKWPLLLQSKQFQILKKKAEILLSVFKWNSHLKSKDCRISENLDSFKFQGTVNCKCHIQLILQDSFRSRCQEWNSPKTLKPTRGNNTIVTISYTTQQPILHVNTKDVSSHLKPLLLVNNTSQILEIF